MKDWRGFRLGCSLAAVAVGVQICVYEQHFVVELGRPATLLLPFQHKCGICLVGALGWMALEVWGAARDRWQQARVR